MQNCEEIVHNPIHTQNGLFVKSPISKSFDEAIDTPQKLPAAPHPSPINMDNESSNPKTKEYFRTELLKACFLKIPEVVADESVFNDYFVAVPSSPCYDPIPDLADSLQGDHLFRQHKKQKLEGDCGAEDETPVDIDAISKVQDFNPGHCTKLYKNENLEESPEESMSGNVNDFGLISECPRNFGSYHFGTSGKVEPPCINVNGADSINMKDSEEEFSDHVMNRETFYDHTTDHQEIFRLLNVSSECKDHSYSLFGSRSPCSDNTSTVAVCASDASDISEEDISTRSMDLGHMGRVEDGPSNANKKKPESAVRRFLNWRRSLKFRKRAASLDESRFPFLANRFGSYKTEFELSV